MSDEAQSFKILATGDVHMYNKMPYAKPTEEGRTDRLDDQIKMWAQMRDYAIEHDIGTIVIGGDLFDKSLVDAVTASETVKSIVSLPGIKYILPGNHDANSVLKAERFTVEVFKEMAREDIFVLGNGERFCPTDWLSIWALPYAAVETNRASLKALQDAVKDAGELVNVLLIHQSILGCRHLNWKCGDGIDKKDRREHGLEPEEVLKGFDFAVAAHFHTHQFFGADQAGMYMGAPMQFNYGDTGEERGFWEIEFFSDKLWNTRLIPVEAPRFYVHNGIDIGDLNHTLKGGDYLRIVVEATHADWVATRSAAEPVLAALHGRGIRAEIKHKPVITHNARILKAGESAPSMENMVERFVDAAMLDDGGKLDKGRLKKLGRDALAAVRG